MNLLKITTTPLKIAISVEKPKFEEAESAATHIDIPFTRTSKRVPKANFTTIPQYKAEEPKKDIYTPVQTTKVSLGYMPLKLKAVNGYRADLANDNMIMTKGGQELSSIIQERILSDQPQVAYIPVTNSGDIKWEPDTLNLEFQSMQVDLDIRNLQKEFKYIPSRLTFEIEQYPSVDIEYIGDPLYVPPSANPNASNEE